MGADAAVGGAVSRLDVNLEVEGHPEPPDKGCAGRCLHLHLRVGVPLARRNEEGAPLRDLGTGDEGGMRPE